MAKRKIIQVPDELLKKKCREVENFDERLFELLDDMKETLRKAEGAGLAAPQVGILRRIFVVDVEEGYFEFINPVIVSQKGSQTGTEGCLSVKGKWGEVVRPEEVVVKFQDRNGEKKTITAKGFFAKAICHENDHLDGILYIDKATDVREEI